MPADAQVVDLVAGGGDQLGLGALAGAEEARPRRRYPEARRRRPAPARRVPRFRRRLSRLLALRVASFLRRCARAAARPPSTTRSLAAPLRARGGAAPAALGDVEQQPDRGEHHKEARVAVGDERQRHAGQRREAEDREQVDDRLDEDQRGEARGEQLAVAVRRAGRSAAPRSRRARTADQSVRARPGRAPRRSRRRSCPCGPPAGRRPSGGSAPSPTPKIPPEPSAIFAWIA